MVGRVILAVRRNRVTAAPALVAILGCVVLAILASARVASAAPAWTPANPLAPTASSLPGVAMNPAGDVAAIWIGQGVVQVSSRPSGGLFSQTVTVSQVGQNALNPHVAITPSGEIIAIWQYGSPNAVIQASVRPPNGSFSPPQTLSSAQQNAAVPQLAVNAAGQAAVVWEYGNFIQAAVRPAGAAFLLPVSISSAGEGPFKPEVAIDELGNVVATWASLNNVIRAAIRTAGGSFASAGFAGPVTLSAAVTQSSKPRVAMDNDGDAIVVWEKPKGTNTVVQASMRPSGGQFAPPPGVDLSPPGQDAFAPQVAMDEDGDAVAVWRQGTSPTIQAAFRGSGGSFGPPAAVSVAGPGTAEIPQEVAMNAAGHAIVVWQAASGGQALIQAAARPPGLGFGAPASLTQALGGLAPSPRVAIDAAGDGIAVWLRGGVPQWAAYDAAGPQLRSLAIPDTGSTDADVVFGVAPVDVFSGISSTTWDFGDGTGASGASVAHRYAAAGTYMVTVRSEDGIRNASVSTRPITITTPPCTDCDNDGFPAGDADCNDFNPAINKGAVDIPNNRVDEDCNGKDARPPTLPTVITLQSARTLGSRAVLLTKLTLKPVVAGSTLRLSCTGRGCRRFKRVTRRITRSSGSRTYSSLLPKRKLTPGAKFEVRVTKPKMIGRVLRFTVYRSKGPVRNSLCIEPNAKRASACRA